MVRYIRDKVSSRKKGWARYLREHMTAEERSVWELIRGKKLGVKFRAQAIIRGWIVDFWCPQLTLVIEVDGEYHNFRREDDRVRDAELSRLGIKTVRIPNEIARQDRDTLAKLLRQIVEERRAELGL